MFKKIILAAAVLFFFISSFALAATGYTNTKCYVYAKPNLKSARKQVSINTKINYSSHNSTFYKIKISSKKYAYIQKKYVSKTKTLKKLTWTEGNKLWKRNTTASLMDITTKKTITVKRVGGLNHFDVEPLTSEDAAILLKICGGTYSWKCHAAILTVGARKIPCSFNSMPHGSFSIQDNNYDGRFCIHLYQSKTHGTNIENKEHQKCVNTAYKYLSK